MKNLIKPLAVAALLTPALSLATVFTFDLQGNAGIGLLPGNINSAVGGVPGTGGEFMAGILFDDVTSILTINIAWGSANGFSDLTSDPFAVNINSSGINFPNIKGEAAFSEGGAVVSQLVSEPTYTFNPSASSGSISGFSVLDAALVQQLFDGQFYLNLQTTENTFGEIRGNLVNATAVPEPSSFAAIAGLAGLGLSLSRRRRA